MEFSENLLNVRGKVQVGIEFGGFELCTVHFMQRAARPCEPPFVSVVAGHHIAVPQMHEGNALVRILFENIDGHLVAADAGGTLGYAAGDFLDGSRSAERLNVLVDKLVGAW